MNDKSNKRAGIIGTVIFHLLLLLFFVTNGLTQPDPLPEQESASIMLGWTDEGSGDGDPSPVPDEVPEEAQPTSDPQPTTAEETVSEDVATQEDSPVAVNEPVKETKPKADKPKIEKPTPEKPKEEPKPSEELQSALDNVWNKPTGGGNGDDDKPGSVGKEDGKPDGKGVFGSGGNSWSLTGRVYEGGAIVTEKPKEEGVIVMEIIVGTNGRVIEARYSAAGSKSTSMHLINLAKKAAMNAMFNVDHSASVQQKGTLTFNFKLK